MLTVKPAIPKKKRTHNRVWFWANDCKYEVILDNAKNINWVLITDEKYESKVNIYWIDVASIHERLRMIQPWQIINHFPGMPNIARKNRMGQNLNKMLKLFPREYSFYPRTWVLPGELSDFRTQFDNQGVSLGNKIFIIKPDTGCQGKGIFLTRTFDNVPQQENVVAQVYIRRPLLLDGYKFDLRIYVLITSVKPLRIYLFQDGLVRMCTQEYTKPNKQNLANACMHLTNYAVNKRNANFQQSNAVNSEDLQHQDEGSKRSLLWFMNSISESHGEAKAKQLWKRIGTLCVRSIITILPTLSREYDLHFKSFTGIPKKMKLKSKDNLTISSACESGTDGSEPSDDDSDDDSDDESSSENDDCHNDDHEVKRNERRAQSVGCDNESKIKDMNGEKRLGNEKLLASKSSSHIETSNDKSIPTDNNNQKKKKTRGSSFGTDSPLDLDIKHRLMEQTLKVIPVRADDEQAYALYQRDQAARRLLAKREREKEEEKMAAAIALAAKTARMNRRKEFLRQQELKKKKEMEELAAEQATAAGVTAHIQNMNRDYGNEEDVTDKEITPERLQEIKSDLVEIYEQYSPDKISKIDKLLAKYAGREEEFLRFVHLKYGLTPPPPPPTAEFSNRRDDGTSTSEMKISDNITISTNSTVSIHHHPIDSSQDTDKDDSNKMPIIKQSSESPSSFGNTNNSNPPILQEIRKSDQLPHRGRGMARSVSPPSHSSSNGSKRSVWKGDEQDEHIFKEEVLRTHIPDDSDEFMKFEQKMLTQFIRIFPPLPPSNDMKLNEKEEEEDDDDDNNEDIDENDENNDLSGKSNGDKEKPMNKIASYEEIILQVFLQDRRQTMRLRCPLPSRARSQSGSADTSSTSLPPLDLKTNAGKETKAPMNFSNNSKGLGWRSPPPKPEPKEVANKVLSQAQTDAAKRLSQGLSVTQMSGPSNNRAKYTGFIPSVVVMDEYNASHGNHLITYDSGNQDEQQNYYNDGDTSLWLNTRLRRIADTNRLNRAKVANGRPLQNPSAVLRQQVFQFGHGSSSNGFLTNSPSNSNNGQNNSSNNSLNTNGFNNGFTNPNTGNTHQERRGSFQNKRDLTVDNLLNQETIRYHMSNTTNASVNSIMGNGSTVVTSNNSFQNKLYGTTVMGQQQSISSQTQNRLSPQNQAVGRAVIKNNGSSTVANDPVDNNDDMLRQLFPGWF